MKSIKERLERLEARCVNSLPMGISPNDDMGFIAALGLDKEDFKTPLGYDLYAALRSTIADTWADYKPLETEEQEMIEYG